MKKSNKVLIGVIILLTIIIIILGGYIVYKEIINKQNETPSNNETSNNQDSKPVNNSSSNNTKVITDGEIVTSTVDYNEPVDLRKYLVNSDENIISNLNINNIMLDGKKVNLKFKNFNTTKCMSEPDSYNLVYLNDELLINGSKQTCYLSSYAFVTVINFKYLAVARSFEGLNSLTLYDKDGNEIDKIEAINFKIADTDIEYVFYEEGDDKYIMNTYSYDYTDKRVTYKIKDGTESYCNQLTGDGYCE